MSSANSNQTASKKVPGRPFKKGQSGNPNGRPKLPEELRAMRDEILSTAVTIIHEKIKDPKYIKELNPHELDHFLELACDRFGLPKVTKSELTGADGEALLPAKQDLPLSRRELTALNQRLDAIIRPEQPRNSN